MKMIRYYSIALGLIALINLGFYASSIRNSSEDIKIAEKEKWEEILVGRWNFSFKEIGVTRIDLYEGEADYYADGTFKQYLSIKNILGGTHTSFEQSNENLILPGQVDLVFSGLITGTWKIGEGNYWEEKPENCSFKTSFCSAKCKEQLQVDTNGLPKPVPSCQLFYYFDKLLYGTVDNKHLRLELIEFSENKILIEGRRSDFNALYYSFEKKS